jgi:hypothetical protein
MQQLLGAASVLVLALTYLLIVQAMMAAIILLAEFMVIQVHRLWTMLPPASEPNPQAEATYKLGGGLARWD